MNEARGPNAIARREDWPSRLAAALEAARDKPFQWGTHDCALWAADVILAMTGVDVAAAYRGAYTDEASAREAMLRIDGGGLRAIGNRAFGPALNNVFMAQRGDVALVEIDGREAAGIVLGATVAVPGPRGLQFAPLDSIVAAWAVARCRQ